MARRLNTLSKALLLVACLAGSVAAQASSVNLVQNGDFSTGDLTGWTTTGSWNYRDHISSDGSDYYLLLQDPGTKGVSQQIGTTAGQSYTLSLDWYTDFNGVFQVLWDGQVIQSMNGNLSGDWDTIVLTVIGQGNDTLALQGYTTYLALNLDNVSLTAVSAVPLPGTALLFGSGMIGLVGLGKKRLSRRAPACAA